MQEYRVILRRGENGSDALRLLPVLIGEGTRKAKVEGHRIAFEIRQVNTR